MTTPPSLRLPGQLTITMLSDWHIGSGAGIPGGVDRSVVRDGDGLPYVPASSLTGVIRASSALVARALDSASDSGAWQEWHAWLFGGLSSDTMQAPARAKVAISSARIEPGARRGLLDGGLAGDTTIVRSSTAIDPLTGTAAEKSLRTIEYARKGTRLIADVAPTSDEPFPSEAVFLLAAALKVTEHLGGKRTRGSGRCRMELTTDPPPEWTAWTNWAAVHSPELPPSSGRSPRTIDMAPGATAGHEDLGWVSLELEVVVIEPVAAEAERRGNTLTTHEQLPGSMLLPAVHERLGSHLAGAIAQGDLQVSDGLPIDNDGHRARVTPLGWLVPKQTTDERRPITDCLFTEPEARVQLQRPDTSFVTIADQDAGFIANPVGVATTNDAHAVIDETTGRPTAKSGGLFMRYAISPGARFGVTVRWRQGLVKNADAKKALEGEWRIGTARRSGYGLVEVTPIATDVTAGNPRAGSSLYVRNLRADDLVVAEARSDVLMRDSRLRWDPTAAGVARHLSIAGWIFEPASSHPGSGASATAVARRDGWHARWSLPRPTLAGLAAGSRVVLRCVTAGDQSALSDLLDRGVGERLAEGFGHLELSGVSPAPGHIEPARSMPTPTRSVIQVTAVDDDFVRLVRRASTRREVQLALETARLPGVDTSRPGASQLGALRNIGSSLALDPSESGLARATKWLEGLCNTQRRAEKWPKGTLDHIAALLEQPVNIWEQLGVKAPGRSSELTIETVGWYLAAAARNGGRS